ncbi:hypothetical protein N8D56_07965 [Devosia sp. A8/3-2]|nr:hypothetical protein N8D56_07965 [Devosia sp. A8/3-2]
MLINQFHDILPGTSIPEVYVDSDNEYGKIFSTPGSANGPRHSAAATLSKNAGGGLKLFNFTGQTRSGLVSVGSDAGLEGTSLSIGGNQHSLQKVTGAGGEIAYVAPVSDLVPRAGRERRSSPGRRPIARRYRCPRAILRMNCSR